MLLQRSNERLLPSDYAGDILLWDIDKTYLDTRFSSWRGLLAIPFEFAIDKRTIPGAVPLLRALRRGPGSESALTPLYFVSGSPPQLRRVIERRMTLDGVDFDGITFKDQLGLLKQRRVAEVRGQIGYKLTALLMYRRELPAAGRWLCFGDDVESDALCFGLFGVICAGLRGAPLRGELASLAVPPRTAADLAELADTLGPARTDPIDRIFIHLERGSDPSAFTDPRVVATRSYVQTALVLRQMRRIDAAAVAVVSRELRLHGMAEAQLEAHVADACTRLDVDAQEASWALGTPRPAPA